MEIIQNLEAIYLNKGKGLAMFDLEGWVIKTLMYAMLFVAWCLMVALIVIIISLGIGYFIWN